MRIGRRRNSHVAIKLRYGGGEGGMESKIDTEVGDGGGGLWVPGDLEMNHSRLDTVRRIVFTSMKLVNVNIGSGEICCGRRLPKVE